MNTLGARNERLTSLPFPLANAARIRSADPTEMLHLEVIGKGSGRNNPSVFRPSSDFALGHIGQIKMLATRTTPCTSIAEDSQYITLAMLYAGDTYRYNMEGESQHIEPGSIHVCQRTGGTAQIGYFSGIICEINESRLQRTARSMSGEAIRWNHQRSYVLSQRQSNAHGNRSQEHLWSLFKFIDTLLGESEYLAAGLGLDEQIYRTLVLSLLEEEGSLEKAQKRWKVATNNWSHPLDDLVDYIRQNAHLNLTLTDLEEQSHYSGRQLQNLFKAKFDCTPMRFVRRQRLTTAMQKLETAAIDETVTNIARDCGYRFASNFTTDFQREFGVKPSVVLRSSQGATT